MLSDSLVTGNKVKYLIKINIFRAFPYLLNKENVSWKTLLSNKTNYPKFYVMISCIKSLNKKKIETKSYSENG